MTSSVSVHHPINNLRPFSNEHGGLGNIVVILDRKIF